MDVDEMIMLLCVAGCVVIVAPSLWLRLRFRLIGHWSLRRQIAAVMARLAALDERVIGAVGARAHRLHPQPKPALGRLRHGH